MRMCTPNFMRPNCKIICQFTIVFKLNNYPPFYRHCLSNREKNWCRANIAWIRTFSSETFYQKRFYLIVSIFWFRTFFFLFPYLLISLAYHNFSFSSFSFAIFKLSFLLLTTKLIFWIHFIFLSLPLLYVFIYSFCFVLLF